MKHLKNTFMTLLLFLHTWSTYYHLYPVCNPKETTIEMVPSIKSAAWDKPLHNEVTFSE